MTRRALTGSALLLLAFVLWTSLTWRPTFVTYHGKYSIFSRNYRQHGVLASRFIPHYNFRLTDPPSTPYVSHPPLVPLVMYAASLFAGDRPPTYYGVIIATHVLAFALLAWLVRRRWGETAALWALVLAVLNRYSLTYGDQQTPELLGAIGGLAAVFLYFEWLDTGRARWIGLASAAYLVGLAADYLTAFTGLTLCAHWLLFVRHKDRRGWLGIALIPVGTMAFVGLMVLLMHAAGVPLARAIEQAVYRSSAHALGVYVLYPLRLLGPVMIAAGLAFPGYLVRRRVQRGPGPDNRTLEVLGCLAAPGFLSVALFGQAFLTHRFLVLYLLPFFAVSAGVGLAWLARAFTSPALARWGAAAIVGIALLAALPSNERFATAQWRPEPVSALRSRYQRLQRLTEEIRPAVRESDRLLILSGGGYSELDKVTVFHALWIPCIDGSGPRAWEGLLAGRPYRLILATDATALEWLRTRPDVGLLAIDGELAFYAAAGG